MELDPCFLELQNELLNRALGTRNYVINRWLAHMYLLGINCG